MSNKGLFGMVNVKSSEVDKKSFYESNEQNESIEELAGLLVQGMVQFNEQVTKEYQIGKAAFESKLEKLHNDTRDKKARIEHKIQEVEKQICDLESESDKVGKAYAKAIVDGASDLKAMEERQFSISSQIATYKSLLNNLQETTVPGDKEIMNEVKQAYKELSDLSTSLREVKSRLSTSLKEALEKIEKNLKDGVFASDMFLGSIENDKLVKAYESVYGKIKVSEDGNFGGAGSEEEAKRRYVASLVK